MIHTYKKRTAAGTNAVGPVPGNVIRKQLKNRNHEYHS